MMIHFTIPGMTCGNCARSITAAIKSIDAQVKVEANIPERRVSIDTVANRDEFVKAIREAGYEASAT